MKQGDHVSGRHYFTNLVFFFSTMENLWEELDEPEFNVDDFEDTFSKAPIKKKATPEKQTSAHKAKEVLKLNRLIDKF